MSLTINHSEMTLQTPDGIQLFVQTWFPPRRGATALDYFYNESSARIKGVVIISPFLQPACDVGAAKMCLTRVLGCILPQLAVLAQVKSSDLTRDADIQKQNDEDPLVLKNFTLGWASQGMIAQTQVLSRSDFVFRFSFAMLARM